MKTRTMSNCDLCNVNLSPSTRVTPKQTFSRANPLNDPGMPRLEEGESPEERREVISEVLQYLNVGHSARYQPSGGNTFCNVYAYDYAFLCRAYLPRVWWTRRALEQVLHGEPPKIVYDVTVKEMTANELFSWLFDFGSTCGWVHIPPGQQAYSELQNAANQGRVALIAARTRDSSRHGHISMVVPETEPHQAKRDSRGRVLAPLESAAGKTCYQYHTFGSPWEMGSQFAAFAYWINDGLGKQGSRTAGGYCRWVKKWFRSLFGKQ